jgi:NAD(P)-dependent dehydrogenase (short-subunit alcohol dehydrogenase family)
VARTVGGLEELDDEIQELGSSATLVPLDLKDGEAIDRLGAAIFERWGLLDGLIANAGLLGVLSPLPHISPEEFETVMAINVTANFRLIRSLDLLLRQSDAGRAVFVSSGAARSARPYWGLYAATKAALDAMVKSWSGEIVQTNVRANVFYPGAVRTAMRAKAMPGEDPETLPAPAEIAPKLVDMIAPGFGENGKLYDIGTGKFTEL